MGRVRRNMFAASGAQHYIVVWDLQWQIIEVARPLRGGDLRAALTAAMSRLEHDGWVREGTEDFGFAFLSRADERRLVMITSRDPYTSAAQSFSPFGP